MTRALKIWLLPTGALLASLLGMTGLLGTTGCADRRCVPCQYGGVWCQVGFQRMAVCGVDQTTAYASCFEAGGSPIGGEPCGHGFGGTGETGGGETGTGETDGSETGEEAPFEPGAAIQFDPAANVYLVDAAFVDQLRANTALLYRDSTWLEHQGDAGYYFVAGEGELSRALGWRLEDVLIGVNGHDLYNLDSALEALVALEQERKFSVDLERDGVLVTLVYVIQ